MMTPPIPQDEDDRLAALARTGLMDTPPDERFDRYTRLAQKLFNVPIALVTLVDADRQWFKSSQGLGAPETPREISFCGHAMLSDHEFVVEDATRDPRFADNPLVTGDPHIKFYAGCALVGPRGHRLGTLCVIDRKVRSLSEDDIESLRDLAALVSSEIATVEMATLDPLTSIANRCAFNLIGEAALKLCVRNRDDACLVMIDLDDFKTINDSFGHQVGDAALAQFATILSGSFRESDIVSRIGGDEFCIFLPGSDGRVATQILERVQRKLDNANAKPDCRYRLRFSHGHVEMDTTVHSQLSDLMRDADRRMYRSKRSKRVPKESVA